VIGNTLNVAIIGAGPIGLEAARQASEAGYDVTLFEKGEIAAHVDQWKQVRLFSPWKMNTTAARDGLSISQYASDKTSTAGEFRDHYLVPLAEQLAKQCRVFSQTRVVQISRGNLCKGDAIGKRDVTGQQFRLLVENDVGERIETADIVLDCSGVFSQPNWLGAGGIPCPGERSCRSKIDYGLSSILANQENYFDKTLLVVGAGYSASTVIAELDELSKVSPKLRVIWATRDPERPVPVATIDNDPLVERHELAERVNQLAVDDRSPITWKRGFLVEQMSNTENAQLRVKLKDRQTGEQESVLVDRVISCTGFHPDGSLTSELQIHECYASNGPMKLAANLLSQNANNCLDIKSTGVDCLVNPEPGYFILGSKSYGRNSHFLMQIGYEQVTQVIEFLKQKQTHSEKLQTQS